MRFAEKTFQPAANPFGPKVLPMSPVRTMKNLVGAGRFERPTPCAQGGLRPSRETAYFQHILIQQDVRSLLNSVELY